MQLHPEMPSLEALLDGLPIQSFDQHDPFFCELFNDASLFQQHVEILRQYYDQTRSIDISAFRGHGLGRLCGLLATRRDLTHMMICDTDIDEEAARAIVSILRNNEAMIQVKFDFCNISPKDGTTVLEAVLSHPSIFCSSVPAFDLGDYHESKTLKAQFIGLFASNCHLETLDMMESNRSTSDGDIELLMQGLQANKSIWGCSIPTKGLTHVGVDHIIEMLKANTSLRILTMRDGDDLSGEDVVRIVAALATNTSLRQFYCKGSSISDQQACQIARSLEKNTSLIAIDVTIPAANSFSFFRMTGGIFSAQPFRSDPKQDIKNVLKRNKAYANFRTAACIFSAILRKDAGVAETFSRLPSDLDLLFLILSLSEKPRYGRSTLYTRNNLNTLFNSVEKCIAQRPASKSQRQLQAGS